LLQERSPFQQRLRRLSKFTLAPAVITIIGMAIRTGVIITMAGTATIMAGTTITTAVIADTDVVTDAAAIVTRRSETQSRNHD
jgi:hypothetical protein